MIIHYIIQSVFVLTGAISLLASAFNWEWFFNAQNSQYIVRSLGRNNARVFYAVIGIVMIVTGVYFYTELKH